MAEFENLSLRQALEKLKADQSKENLLKASRALINTKVLCPAKWDKEPTMEEDGNMHFAPDTRVQLMVVTNKEGQKFYPFFTGMQEVQNLYKEEPVQCLILGLPQYLNFLKASEGGIQGIVIDPASLNVVFPTKFVEGIAKAEKNPLNQNTIHKGEKVHVRNLSKEYQDLEAALISTGFHEKPVRAIYIKERMEDPQNPDKTHWFVIVDSDELDTGIFNRIGAACRDAMHGKQMEFMFTDQKLGSDIARTSKPIYTRVMH